MSGLPARLSPTSIDRWRVCPRRFLYQDVRKLEFEDVKTYEQTLGEVVHRVLEGLFRLPPHQRNEESVERLLDWNMLRFAAVPALRKANADRLREEARGQLRSFLRTRAADGDAIKVEASFQLRLNTGTVIQTRVDRIDRAESGSLHVIDYKTGRLQLDESDLGRETAPVVHLLSVSKASEIAVEKVIWVYLRSGEAIEWSPEEEDIEWATGRLLRLLEQMRHDDEFAPNPGAHCVTCPFTHICPEWSSQSERA
jgi:putative RecB family exonuclease